MTLTVTPDSVAAAPTIAYSPGTTQSRSPRQKVKYPESGVDFACIHWTRIPKILPAHAPTPKVGMKIPAGTLIPKVMMVSPPLMERAIRRALIMGMACVGGSRTQRPDWLPGLQSSKSLYTSSVPPILV